MDQFPDFLSPDFLTSHMREIMAFYHPRCLNTEDGGYYNEYRDDGFILDRKTQHIVSTTRFIFNYTTAAVIFDRPDYAEAAAHGIRYLDEVHRDPEHGGYFWVMNGREASVVTPAKSRKLSSTFLRKSSWKSIGTSMTRKPSSPASPGLRILERMDELPTCTRKFSGRKRSRPLLSHTAFENT